MEGWVLLLSVVVACLLNNTHAATSYWSLLGGEQEGGSRALPYNAPQVFPGGRSFGASWTDFQSNRWLFGGVGRGSSCITNILGDMWVHNSATTEWSLVEQFGDIPSARKMPMTWSIIGAQTTFFLFGGVTSNSTEAPTEVAMYSFDVNSRTWNKVMSTGASAPNYVGPYSPGARKGSVAFVLNNYLYLFGGQDNNLDYRNDMWRFHTGLNTWEYIELVNGQTIGSSFTNQVESESLPGGLMGAAYGKVANLVSVIGGKTPSGVPSNKIWQFNIDTNIWTKIYTLDTYIYYSSAWYASPYLYAFGGLNAGNAPVADIYMINGTAVIRSIALAGARCAAFAFDGFGIFGGYGIGFDFYGNSNIVGHKGDMWTLVYTAQLLSTFILGATRVNAVARTSIVAGDPIYGLNWPGPRANATSVIDGQGDFWLFGGYLKLECDYGLGNDLWKYRKDTNTWSLEYELTSLDDTSTEILPGGSANAGAWFHPNDPNLLYFYGGERKAFGGRITSNEMWQWSLAQQSWTLVGSFNQRNGIVSFTISSTLYFFGGDPSVNDNNVYKFNGGTWNEVVDGDSQRRGVEKDFIKPSSRQFAVSWPHEHGIWIFGGYHLFFPDSFAKFDITTDDKWATFNLASTPAKRYGSLTWKNAIGHLLCFGGVVADDVYPRPWTNEMWVYDPDSQIWHDISEEYPISSLNYGASWGQASYVYAFGGYKDADNLYSNQLQMLDPCQIQNGGCGPSFVCLHSSETDVVCEQVYTPSYEFTFKSALFAVGQPLAFQGPSPTYTTTTCGLGIKVPTYYTTSVGNYHQGMDFSGSWTISIRFDLQQSPLQYANTIGIFKIGDTCEDGIEINYVEDNFEIMIGTQRITVSPTQTNGSHTITLTKEAAQVYAYVDELPGSGVNGASASFTEMDYVVIGRHISCINYYTALSLVIDELLFFNVSIPAANIFDIRECRDTSKTITQCGNTYEFSNDTLYIVGTLSGVAPCISIVNSHNATVRGGSITSVNPNTLGFYTTGVSDFTISSVYMANTSINLASSAYIGNITVHNVTWNAPNTLCLAVGSHLNSIINVLECTFDRFETAIFMYDIDKANVQDNTFLRSTSALVSITAHTYITFINNEASNIVGTGFWVIAPAGLFILNSVTQGVAVNVAVSVMGAMTNWDVSQNTISNIGLVTSPDISAMQIDCAVPATIVANNNNISHITGTKCGYSSMITILSCISLVQNNNLDDLALPYYDFSCTVMPRITGITISSNEYASLSSKVVNNIRAPLLPRNFSTVTYGTEVSTAAVFTKESVVQIFTEIYTNIYGASMAPCSGGGCTNSKGYAAAAIFGVFSSTNFYVYTQSLQVSVYGGNGAVTSTLLRSAQIDNSGGNAYGIYSSLNGTIQINGNNFYSLYGGNSGPTSGDILRCDAGQGLISNQEYIGSGIIAQDFHNGFTCDAAQPLSACGEYVSGGSYYLSTSFTFATINCFVFKTANFTFTNPFSNTLTGSVNSAVAISVSPGLTGVIDGMILSKGGIQIFDSCTVTITNTIITDTKNPIHTTNSYSITVNSSTITGGETAILVSAKYASINYNTLYGPLFAIQMTMAVDGNGYAKANTIYDATGFVFAIFLSNARSQAQVLNNNVFRGTFASSMITVLAGDIRNVARIEDNTVKDSVLNSSTGLMTVVSLINGDHFLSRNTISNITTRCASFAAFFRAINANVTTSANNLNNMHPDNYWSNCPKSPVSVGIYVLNSNLTSTSDTIAQIESFSYGAANTDATSFIPDKFGTIGIAAISSKTTLTGTQIKALSAKDMPDCVTEACEISKTGNSVIGIFMNGFTKTLLKSVTIQDLRGGRAGRLLRHSSPSATAIGGNAIGVYTNGGLLNASSDSNTADFRGGNGIFYVADGVTNNLMCAGGVATQTESAGYNPFTGTPGVTGESCVMDIVLNVPHFLWLPATGIHDVKMVIQTGLKTYSATDPLTSLKFNDCRNVTIIGTTGVYQCSPSGSVPCPPIYVFQNCTDVSVSNINSKGAPVISTTAAKGTISVVHNTGEELASSTPFIAIESTYVAQVIVSTTSLQNSVNGIRVKCPLCTVTLTGNHVSNTSHLGYAVRAAQVSLAQLNYFTGAGYGYVVELTGNNPSVFRKNYILAAQPTNSSWFGFSITCSKPTTLVTVNEHEIDYVYAAGISCPSSLTGYTLSTCNFDIMLLKIDQMKVVPSADCLPQVGGVEILNSVAQGIQGININSMTVRTSSYGVTSQLDSLFGLRLDSVTTATLNDIRIYDLSVTDTPACSGCTDTSGVSVAAMLINNSTLTISNVNISTITAGSAGDSNVMHKATGGNAFAAHILQGSVSILTIDGTFTNINFITAGNGGNGENATDCSAGRAYAFYQDGELPISANIGILLSGIGCFMRKNITRCGTYINLSDTILYLTQNISYSNALGDACIVVRNVTNVVFEGLGNAINCNTVGGTYAINIAGDCSNIVISNMVINRGAGVMVNTYAQNVTIQQSKLIQLTWGVLAGAPVRILSSYFYGCNYVVYLLSIEPLRLWMSYNTIVEGNYGIYLTSSTFVPQVIIVNNTFSGMRSYAMFATFVSGTVRGNVFRDCRYPLEARIGPGKTFTMVNNTVKASTLLFGAFVIDCDNSVAGSQVILSSNSFLNLNLSNEFCLQDNFGVIRLENCYNISVDTNRIDTVTALDACSVPIGINLINSQSVRISDSIITDMSSPNPSNALISQAMMGIFVNSPIFSTSIYVRDTVIRKLSVGPTASCTKCNVTSGRSVYGIYQLFASSSYFQLINVSISELVGGAAGAHSSPLNGTTHLATGGNATAIYTLFPTTVELAGGEIYDMIGGNGGTYYAVDNTVCTGGKGNYNNPENIPAYASTQRGSLVDGTDCALPNPCAGCSGNATCVMDGNSLSCACNFGFTGDGTTCTESAIICSDTVIGKEALNNTGFETAQSWIGPFNTVPVAESKGCGASSMKLVGQAQQNVIIQNVTLNRVISKTMLFSVWGRIQGAGNGEYVVQVLLASQSGAEVVHVHAFPPGTYGWVQYSFNYPTGDPISYARVAFTQRPNASGYAYFDQVTLKEIIECGNATCADGYRCDSSSVTCIDINECAETPNLCNNTSLYCINKPGSYYCSPCEAGYTPGPDGSSCIDVNECDLGVCDPHVKCNNKPGNYTCDPCPKGYNGTGYGVCEALCGNDICEPFLEEDCLSCPLDCKNSTCNACGDAVCDSHENCNNCYVDCKANCTQTQCGGTPVCSAHGTCVDGACICQGDYSGPICNVFNKPINVSVNYNNTDVTISAAVSFKIALTAIKEIDESNNLISGINITDIAFTPRNDTDTANSTVFVFSSVLKNQANLTITIRSFTNTSLLKFANKTNSFAANTIKLGVTVANWPFNNLHNTLSLIFDARDAEKLANRCNVNADKDGGGSLKWITITMNNITMYGQFLEDAVIDGKNRIITYNLNDDNSVSAILPHFWVQAEMDPSYSVLVGSGQDKCGNPIEANKGVSHTVLIAVLVTVGGLALICVAAYFIYPKLKLAYEVRKGRASADVTMDDLANSSGSIGGRQIDPPWWRKVWMKMGGGAGMEHVPSSPQMSTTPSFERTPDMHVRTVAGEYTVRM